MKTLPQPKFRPTRPLLASAPTTALLVTVLLAAPLSAQQSPVTASDLAEPAVPSTAAAETRLPTVVVTETAEPLTAPSEETAAAELDEVAGNTSIIKSESGSAVGGRAATAADLLKFQPGVYAASAGGNDALRISIRGSGINRGPGSFREGIHFLFDGLPVTGPGGTPFELFDPLGLNYTEILRGGNAFKYGALALGGAINYVTRTGYEASPAQIRGEAGSFGYYKGQVSSGYVFNNVDYYAMGTGGYRSGFQQHSTVDSARVAANFGWQVAPNLDTRFYFRFGYTDFEQPGQISGREIKNEPRVANPLNVANNAGRLQPGSQWIANKTILTLPDTSTLELGLVYHNYPIEIYGAEFSRWWFGDINTTIRYNRTDEIFGRQSLTQLAFFSTTHAYAGWDTYQNNRSAPNYGKKLKNVDADGSGNYVWSLGNDFELVPNLWLTSGFAFIFIQRNSDITFPVNESFSQSTFDFAPRVGLRYNVLPNWQLYSNFSRTIEPADSWKYSGGSSSSQLFNRDLQPQRALTIEVGTRGEAGIFAWDVAWYYSWIEDELLTAQVAPGPPPVTANTNASRTIHQGVEVGLDTVIWDWTEEPEPAVAGKDFKQPVNVEPPRPNRLTLRQAFTWNNFRFVNDPEFGKNQLPGLPEYFYQAELRYEHPTGLYASFAAQAASSYPVDYANTWDTAPYVSFDITFGWRSPRNRDIEAYVQFANITDARYATSVSPIYNAGGTDQRVQSPADGFGVYGGLSWAF